MKTKAMMKDHFRSNRITTIKRTANKQKRTSTTEDVKKKMQLLVFCWQDCEISIVIPEKVKHKVTLRSSNPLPE